MNEVKLSPEERAILIFDFKCRVIKAALRLKKVKEVCSLFHIPRSTYYEWKKKYDAEGFEGLRRKIPRENHLPHRLSQNVIDKIIELRKEYQLGAIRITWYLERYHGIKTSESTVYRTLVRHGLNRLPKTASRRSIHTKRYSKNVPGHQVQVDVKFTSLTDPDGKKARRYQFTAIDDATRIRALRIYKKHNQTSAIDFIDLSLRDFHSVLIQYELTEGTSSKRSSIGMLKIWE